MQMETALFDTIETYESEDIMSLNHSRIIHRVSVALDHYKDQYDIFPELELELSSGKCKPDVSIYPTVPTDWLNDVIFYTKPPILAIEILSPKQALNDLTDKAYKQYFPAGVPVVWIIVPVLQHVYAFFADGTRQNCYNGVLHDTTTGIGLDLVAIFR